ncbi:MAG: phage Gp37/Gp68 family protein [Chitinispirillales bacterium]|jgi:protein gp37|nr:phage Gp37/Gp68 family protein [Chitinispirillales bacterium]
MKATKIEWTEATWNPSVGCSKVTDGCKNCYAEIMAKRLQAMGACGYEDGFKFKILPERLSQPLSIRKPTKFFVNSMSDLFHKNMPFEFLDRIFEVIEKTPQHNYQILTKRESILKKYFLKRTAPKNVWLGVTVEHGGTKNRIDVLRSIETSVRFISIEPLIGDIGELNLKGIHWVIVGGESGVSARPMNSKWAVNIQKQCAEQKIAFFFKQWGTWGADGVRRNKKKNGSILLGREWKEEPVLS